jgi:hypothetical protein
MTRKIWALGWVYSRHDITPVLTDPKPQVTASPNPIRRIPVIKEVGIMVGNSKRLILKREDTKRNGD